MIEAEVELRQAMEAYGIVPPRTIKWDMGEIERFPSDGKRGKNGFYKAHSDPPINAYFGCHKLVPEGVRWWYKNGKSDDYDKEKWAEIQAQQDQDDKDREEVAKEVASECQRRFDKAKEPNPDHPYLVKKGIKDPKGIKQEGAKLLIPVKSMAKGNPIMSIQEVSPKGKKMFVKGGRIGGGRTTINSGAILRGKPIYITEGWATGWTISEVLGVPVVVAFSAGSLAEVARNMRVKFPERQIVIAADNDRWSQTGDMKNPGVSYARKASVSAHTLVAVPDFENLEAEPTDFNDLMMLEGKEAVEKWLDPVNAHKARINPPQTIPVDPGGIVFSDDGPEEEIELLEAPEEGSAWEQNENFRCLGYDRDTYHYLPTGKGQLTLLSPTQHQKLTLLPLAPLAWWEASFPGSKGANWLVAADAMMRTSHKVGVFSHENLRGRGLWTVENPDGSKGVILHLGDRLLAPGSKKYIAPEAYKCPEKKIYERVKRLAGPSKTKAMTLEEAEVVLNLFKDLLWHDESSAILAAGWTAMAPLGGCLKWRPHIWLTGGAGSGKTTVVRDLIQPLLGGMRFYFEGDSTEAGIRHRVRSDAVPILYDEADRHDARAEPRIQKIIALARSASSMGDTAEVAKGNPHGGVLSYHVRSMFCMASIGGALRGQQDKQRICLLQMRSKGNVGEGVKNKHWRAYSPRLNKVTGKWGRELVARTLGWARDGRMEETLDVFKEAAANTLGDARSGDQFGTLYAGAWMLMSDEPPTALDAKEMIGSEDLEHFVDEQVPEGKRALRILLQKQERVDTSSGVKTLSVGQLIGIATGEMLGGVSTEEATNRLKILGFRIEVFDGVRMLLVANSSEWIKHALVETPFTSISDTLRTLPDTMTTKNYRFYAGLNCRTTALPLDSLEE